MGFRVTISMKLVDHICDFIDHPADLLSTALTNKAVYNIVIPNHLPYRRIKCGINSTNIWLGLSSNPSIAQKIRYLYIVPDDTKESHQIPTLTTQTSKKLDGEGGSARPPLLGDRSKTDGQQMLAAAIRCMPLLRGFYWHTSDECPSNSIFEALDHTQPTLDTFEMLDWAEDNRYPRIKRLDSSKLFGFSNLVNFSYSRRFVDTSAERQEEIGRQLVDMLTNRCSELQSLQILFSTSAGGSRFIQASGETLFKIGRWPNLRRLSVEGDILVANHEAFFAAHPFLEALAIKHTRSEDFEFDFSQLKQLRSLEIDTIPKKKGLPKDVLVKLQHLDITFLHFGSEYCKNANEILSETHVLKSLIIRYPGTGIEFSDLKPLCGSLQHLEKLAVESMWGLWLLAPRHYKAEREVVASILKTMPALTHFRPLFAVDWVVEEQEQEEQEQEQEEQEQEREEQEQEQEESDEEQEQEEQEQEEEEQDQESDEEEEEQEESDEEEEEEEEEEESDEGSDSEREIDFVDTTLTSALEFAPKLRFVGVTDISSIEPEWFVVDRDIGGEYAGRHAAESTRDKKEVNINMWGGIYYGAGEKVVTRRTLYR